MSVAFYVLTGNKYDDLCFQIFMSKNKMLEMLVVLVDGEHVEIIKRRVRLYSFRKENILST